MRPAAPEKETAVCSRSGKTTSPVGPSPKREVLARRRSPHRHRPSHRAHRARSARADTERRKTPGSRQPLRNPMHRRQCARQARVHRRRSRPATSHPYRLRHRLAPLGRGELRRARSDPASISGFDAAWSVQPFIACTQGATPRVAQGAAVRGTTREVHCAGHRGRTVRCEQPRSVSGPGVRGGYRRRPVYGAQAPRWPASTRRPATAAKDAHRVG